MNKGSSNPYVIDYAEEHARLERQARIGNIENHLQRFSFAKDATILDAECGSGAMTRLLAKAASQGKVIGLDSNESYLNYAFNNSLFILLLYPLDT